MATPAPFDMKEHVRALVDQAPPPTPEQLDRLRLILWPQSAEDPAAVAAKWTPPPPPPVKTPKPPLIPTSAKGGHIYVIEFSSGTVKVGQTATGTPRMRQHRIEAARHGVEVVNEWLSPAYEGFDDDERKLIDFCAERGVVRGDPHGRSGLPRRSEYFTGLDFDEIQAFAASLAE